jgi:hypothetical protein
MPRGRLGRTPKSLKISGEKATGVKRVTNAEGNGALPVPGPGRPKGNAVSARAARWALLVLRAWWDRRPFCVGRATSALLTLGN